MSSPGDQPRTCAFCGNPAIGEYTRKGHTVMVCATCSDQQKARDALDDNIVRIIELGQDGKSDKAIACLNEILESHRHLDHDGWLARNIAMSRAHILLDAGRHEESLHAFHEEERLGFADTSLRWLNASGKADALSALGRNQDALAALEDALGYEDPKYLPSALGPLVKIVHLSEKLGQQVDPKWRSVAEAVAKYHGIDMPAQDSLAKAILGIAKILESMSSPPHPG